MRIFFTMPLSCLLIHSPRIVNPKLCQGNTKCYESYAKSIASCATSCIATSEAGAFAIIFRIVAFLCIITDLIGITGFIVCTHNCEEKNNINRAHGDLICILDFVRSSLERFHVNPYQERGNEAYSHRKKHDESQLAWGSGRCTPRAVA